MRRLIMWNMVTLDGYFEEFSGTWPRRGTMRNGSLYRLPMWGRPTSGSGFGYWPTPTTAAEAPNMGSSKRTEPRSLLQVAREMWPTPTESDGMGGPGSTGRDGGENLRTAIGGQLNPTWCEWLMGFPLGWTDLGGLATPSSRRSRK